MAHFLSEATHQRLELRDIPADVVDEERAYSTGVVKTHVFQSAIRGLTVVSNSHSDDARALGRHTAGDAPTAFAATMRKGLRQGALDSASGVDPSVDAMPRLQVWSGDTIGTVTARLGLTGAPQHILSQPREKGVYAFSMHHHAPHVWVGYSDGFLHVFDAVSGARVCEMRAHTAAINAIITVGNYVFTAGSDWQILQWDPVELKRVPHGQFSGHQNAVRCLAGSTADSSASGVLYSGGDDFVVRCWDLDTGYERSDPWPIIGHTGAVRAIAVHGVYLFTASSDGQVKAWNTQTAQLVRTLDDRGPGVSIGSLAVDAASPAVWAGGTDGIIRMWGAQSLVLIGERTDHHATHVACLTSVARANAVKAWILDSSGALTTVFSDPDGACSTTGVGGYKALQPLEQELQRTVDSNRNKILHNYSELERCRNEFDGLQARERASKSRFASAAAVNRRSVLAITFHHQAATFLEKRRYRDVAIKRAGRLAVDSNQRFHRRYFSQWLHFAACKMDAAQANRVVTAIAGQRERALVVRYARVLQEHARQAEASAMRRICAHVMASHSQLGLLQVYFWAWHRARESRVLGRQRTPFVRATQKLNASSLLASYWVKLRNAVVADRAETAHRSTIKFLSTDAPTRLMRSAFAKWARYKQIRVHTESANKAVTLLGDISARELAALGFSRWLVTVKLRRRDALHERYDRETADLAEVQRAVDGSEGINEAALEESLAAKQQELARLRQEEQVWDARLQRRALHKRHLQREALRCPAINSNEPLQDQLTQAMYLLKARGVNLKQNEEDILQARQAVAESSAATVFAEGLGMVRKICASAVRPMPLTDPGYACWFVGPLFDRITEKQVLKAAQGLSRMVTAYDMMNVKQLGAQWLSLAPNGRQTWMLPQANEAIENLGTLLELALRAYRIHRGEDMAHGGPKPERRVRSRSPSQPRSRSKSASKSKTKPRSKSAPKKRAKSKTKQADAGEGPSADPAEPPVGGQTQALEMP
jgi:WD40 repeat protein